MGNCSACCGKADSNEVTTEKYMNKSGKTKDGEQFMEDIETKQAPEVNLLINLIPHRKEEWEVKLKWKK